MSRALSLPREHGGYLTIAGAAVVGIALSHAHAAALAVGLLVAASFFARAPVEQLARGHGARWDAMAIVALGAAILTQVLVLGRAWALVGLAVVAAVLGSSVTARRARSHRDLWFETVGMTMLGASAGLIAFVGGAELRVAAAVAIAVGAHSGTAVPLVRAEVRPRERSRGRHTALVSLAVLAVAACVLVLAGAGRFALALAPRALHALVRAIHAPAPTRPSLIGWRETAMLAATTLLLIWC
jgi:hypothetical protein